MIKSTTVGNWEAVPVVALTLEGEFVGRYDSSNRAAVKLGLPTGSVIACITGRSAYAGNYLFLEESKYDPTVKVTKDSIIRKKKFLNSKRKPSK